MEHRPGCLVAAQPQYPLQTRSTRAVFLAGNLPYRAEPYHQRQLTVLKNCSCSNRCLPPTCLATPKTPSNRQPLTPSATWTDKPFRPSQRGQIFPTRCVITKPPFEFHQRFGIIFHHRVICYISRLVEPSKYPFCWDMYGHRVGW